MGSTFGLSKLEIVLTGKVVLLSSTTESVLVAAEDDAASLDGAVLFEDVFVETVSAVIVWVEVVCVDVVCVDVVCVVVVENVSGHVFNASSQQSPRTLHARSHVQTLSLGAFPQPICEHVE